MDNSPWIVVRISKTEVVVSTDSVDVDTANLPSTSNDRVVARPEPSSTRPMDSVVSIVDNNSTGSVTVGRFSFSVSISGVIVVVIGEIDTGDWDVTC